MVTEMLELWTVAAEEKGVVLTGDVLCTKFKQFLDHAGIMPEDQLKLSNFWLNSIKNRLGLHLQVHHGEAGSANASNVAMEQVCLQGILAKYSPMDIYNGDETGVYYL